MNIYCNVFSRIFKLTFVIFGKNFDIKRGASVCPRKILAVAFIDSHGLQKSNEIQQNQFCILSNAHLPSAHY